MSALGIIGQALAAGLSGAGEGMAMGAQQEMKDQSRAKEIDELAQAEIMKKAAIDRNAVNLANEPLNRYTEMAKRYANAEVPDTAGVAPMQTVAPPQQDKLASLVAAITDVESGGNPDAVSPQGATGSMQIMPDTFKQYAKPGESYENDGDRRAAAIRKIEDDYQHYNGDVAKTAAAYIGGRGAVTADGKIRGDVKDSLGTTPAAYAQKVMASMPQESDTGSEEAPMTAAPASGKMRKMTSREISKAVLDELRTTDLPAYEASHKALKGAHVSMGPQGEIVDDVTGEVVAKNTSGMEALKAKLAATSARDDKLIASKEGIAANRNQTLKEVTAAKVAGQYGDPATMSPDVKNIWVGLFAANGSVPKNAPAVVKNNVATWAAEKGITSEDIAKGRAQQKFDLSAAQTSGNRSGSMAAVEAVMPAIVQNAIEKAEVLNQGRFVPLNKLMQMSESNISDPDLSALKVAHQAVVSEYQQVISRGGQGNVTSLKEAMDVLSRSTSLAAYKSALNQVQKEVELNVAGIAKVRADIGGSGSHGKTQAVPNQMNSTPEAGDGWSNFRVH